MSKNIIMTELTSNGYQELYPKTIGSQVEGKVNESIHSMTADVANVADLKWTTLFKNSYTIPSTKGTQQWVSRGGIPENSFSIQPLFNCNFVLINCTVSGFTSYNLSSLTYEQTYFSTKLPFGNATTTIFPMNTVGDLALPTFSFRYYGKLFPNIWSNGHIKWSGQYEGIGNGSFTIERDLKTMVNKYAGVMSMQMPANNNDPNLVYASSFNLTIEIKIN